MVVCNLNSMKYLFKIILSVVISITTLACQSTERKPTATSNEDITELTKVLEAFLGSSIADCRKLTRELYPDSLAIIAIMDTALYDTTAAYLNRIQKERFTIQPRYDHKDIIIYKATTEDLKLGTTNALNFPSDYHYLAAHLTKNLTLYRAKFVVPGYQAGAAYDLFVKINGRWVFFPELYKVI